MGLVLPGYLDDAPECDLKCAQADALAYSEMQAEKDRADFEQLAYAVAVVFVVAVVWLVFGRAILNAMGKRRAAAADAAKVARTGKGRLHFRKPD